MNRVLMLTSANYDQSVQPESVLQSLPHDYERLRPCAPPWYSCGDHPLDRLPSHRSDRFSRSVWKPGSRHLHAGRRYHRALPNLVPGALLVSTSPRNLSTRHQGFAHARLRDPHLTGIACLFRQRSRQWLLTDAAWGGLKPAPESRLRYPSSSIQLRKPDG